MPRTTPADYDFHTRIDALRPALGKMAPWFAFYDVTLAGKRRLVAHLPDFGALDREQVVRVGDALVGKAMEKGAERPRLVCLELSGEVAGARLLRAAKPFKPARAAGGGKK